MSEKNCLNKAPIVEVFSSIQGEGLNVGELQIFVRFSGCNLSCKYCDTNHSIKNAINYTPIELMEKINAFSGETISLTGGEPLLHSDFLAEFLRKTNKKIYLETNGTLYNNLEKIINLVDIVAMDIKLESATKEKNRFLDNEKFAQIASKKNLMIKIVFDENITDDEILNVVKIAKTVSAPVVLQPKMPMTKNFIPQNTFNKFYNLYKNIRLIPQTHKFLNIR